MRKWLIRIRYILLASLGYGLFIYCKFNPEFAKINMLWDICFLFVGIVDTYIIIRRVKEHTW